MESILEYQNRGQAWILCPWETNVHR